VFLIDDGFIQIIRWEQSAVSSIPPMLETHQNPVLALFSARNYNAMRLILNIRDTARILSSFDLTVV